MSGVSLPTGFVISALLCASWSAPAGAQWVYNGVEASSTASHMVAPEIAVDAYDGALVVWVENSDGYFPVGDLFVQRYATDGTVAWGNGVRVTLPGTSGTDYRVVPDGEAGAVVAWGDDAGAWRIQRVNFLGSTAWTAGGVAVAPGLPLPVVSANGTTVSNTGHIALLPLGGGAFAAYEGFGGNDVDVFVQKIDPSGAIQWGPTGVKACGATLEQYAPAIVPDGEGGVIVAWQDARTTPGYPDVYAQRIGFLGTPLWATNGVPICTATGTQAPVLMISDGAGGAFIAWQDIRGSWVTVYAQHVDASGVVQWTADGVAVAPADGNQTALSLVGDDRGGAYFAWIDTRVYAAERAEVFGQRIDRDGVARWGSSGQRLTYAAANLDSHGPTCAARDGSGGVIVAYTPYDYGSSDYLGVRVLDADSTGAVLWDEVSADSSTRGGKPVMVEAGTGAAIVAWEDRRDVGPYSVYAQKSPMVASAVRDRPPAAAGLELFVSPNPFSGGTIVRFVLPSASDVRLDVYDARGRRVAFRRYDRLASGERSIGFDGRDERGSVLPSGVYFLRVTAAGRQAVRKLVLMH